MVAKVPCIRRLLTSVAKLPGKYCPITITGYAEGIYTKPFARNLSRPNTVVHSTCEICMVNRFEKRRAKIESFRFQHEPLVTKIKYNPIPNQ